MVVQKTQIPTIEKKYMPTIKYGIIGIMDSIDASGKKLHLGHGGNF